MRKIIITILVLIAGLTNAQNNLTKNITSNAENDYVAVRVDNYSYIHYHKNMKATKYNNCLIETNSPIQLFRIYRNYLKRFFNINTLYYNEVFTENKQYTDSEISKIVDDYKIDLFIKIGFNLDVYNQGSISRGAIVGTPLPGVTLTGGRSKDRRGKIVKIYIDFYDKQFESMPFVKVEGMKNSRDDNEIRIVRQMFEAISSKLTRSKLIIANKDKGTKASKK